MIANLHFERHSASLCASPEQNREEGGLLRRRLGGQTWTERYGKRHALVRVTDFPAGIVAPEKVRIYRRQGHYILQCWDPSEKGSLSVRVEGDLVVAIMRAREIDERLSAFRSTGIVRKAGITHGQLVAAFMRDLEQRANAEEIDPATVKRYAAALQHYCAFCLRPDVAKLFPNPSLVNREFRLQFAAFLSHRQVPANGNAGSQSRPMKSQSFVMDTVRALFVWASDSQRGKLLSDGFRNPFLRSSSPRTVLKGDPLADPDISTKMAVELVNACDFQQLRLFAPMLLFGLRASEPCCVFREHLVEGWLQVCCLPDLGYATKGRRDKRLPLIGELGELWNLLDQGSGLLYLRKKVVEKVETPKLVGATVGEMIAAYRSRCGAETQLGAASRQVIRNRLIQDAGGLNYDMIQEEFHTLAQKLDWPPSATLKDLRHLFATTMNNAGMPEAYRRYLMGQSPGKAAINAYTHLNDLRRHYTEAVQREWSSLLEVIRKRCVAFSRGEGRAVPSADK